MRVLIAEDDPLCQLHVQSVAAHLSHEVIVCDTGLDAWEQFLRYRPQLVVTDWLMPEVSGLELCRRIREVDGRDTYVILITALEGDADRVEALEAGANDVVVKPLSSDDLALRLRLAERVMLGDSASDETAMRARLTELAGKDMDSVRSLAASYAARGEHVKARAFMRRHLATLESVLGPEHAQVVDLRASIAALKA